MSRNEDIQIAIDRVLRALDTEWILAKEELLRHLKVLLLIQRRALKETEEGTEEVQG